uniref:hypothetical chloroplast RF4 n=1 Tax=Chlorococcum tatrense TaxID=915274 RepID=UPI0010C4B2EE|nr:hypothetical chloroplast RF4 [Chlorococcum tatrense]AYQ94334.1 hypothetical chloroplast RF4 [Chlorococcum tatrense]
MNNQTVKKSVYTSPFNSGRSAYFSKSMGVGVKVTALSPGISGEQTLGVKKNLSFLNNGFFLKTGVLGFFKAQPGKRTSLAAAIPGLTNYDVTPSFGSGTEQSKRSTGGQNLIRRYIILGERRTSNYLWAFIVFLGSFGFLLTGLSSYYQLNLIAPSDGESISALFPTVKDLSFFPQGLLMSIYGSLGFLLSFYWGFNIFWNVGGGFNEFNKKEGKIRVFRWGYPGKNRRIDLSYSLKDVEAIKVELKQGLDPQRTIYLKLKGKREIPLTGIGEPLTLKEIEKQASELANFLQVSLEGL